YELTRPPDGAWGQLADDGSWSGMIGMLARKEVDLALGPFATTYNRAQVVTFTPSIVLDPLCVVAGRQNPKQNPWGFLESLGYTTWLGIFLSLLAITAAITAISPRGRTDASNWMTRIFNVFYELYRVPLLQGTTLAKLSLTQVSSEQVNALAVRAVLGTWLVFVMVVMNCFTSALVSILAVQYVPIEFKNLQDIIHHPTIKVIIEKNSAITELFR
ncbi:Ionotropic receptor 142, partial [Hyalella azteca]